MENKLLYFLDIITEFVNSLILLTDLCNRIAIILLLESNILHL
jgi:hypothetical protein